MSDALDPAAHDPIVDSDAGHPSAQNAVTHGLTARRPLHEQEAERMIAIAQQWTRNHRPETEPEEALIHAAAIEYVRYLRCVDAEEARLGPAVRQARADWEEKRRHAVRRKAQDLAAHPRRVVDELHESAFGIDWMLRHWRALLGRVDAGRPWYGDDLMMAMRLIGRPPEPPAETDRDGRALWEAVLAAFPVVDRMPMVGPAEALARLRAILADRIVRLDDLRPIVWEEVDEPEARAVEVAALSDTSKEGQLRHRYRREAFRDWQKSLGMVMRLKSERSKIEDRDSKRERREQSMPHRFGGVGSAAPVAREVAAGPPAADSRNEPPEGRPPAAEDRPNPNEGKENGHSTPARSPEPPRRTGTVPGGAPGHPDRPIAGPSAPRRADHPARVRPPMPDRDA